MGLKEPLKENASAQQSKKKEYHTLKKTSHASTRYTTKRNDSSCFTGRGKIASEGWCCVWVVQPPEGAHHTEGAASAPPTVEWRTTCSAQNGQEVQIWGLPALDSGHRSQEWQCHAEKASTLSIYISTCVLTFKHLTGPQRLAYMSPESLAGNKVHMLLIDEGNHLSC